MNVKQRSQYSQGTNTDNRQGIRSGNLSKQVSKNDDITLGVRAEEQPSTDPKINPDMPPGPARREYDDTGHEHEHKDPTAHPVHK